MVHRLSFYHNFFCFKEHDEISKWTLQRKWLKIGVITQSFYRQKVESFNPRELVKDDRPQNTW